MRRNQHIGAQMFRHGREQGALAMTLNVRGNQHAARIGGDFQHAAALIVLELFRGLRRHIRIQHLERYAVPLPGLPRRAATLLRPDQQQRIEIRQRGQHCRDRHGLHHRQRTAGVINVVMTQHQRIQTANAGGAQKRHDHAIAAVRRRTKGGTGIEQQRMIAGLRHH